MRIRVVLDSHLAVDLSIKRTVKRHSVVTMTNESRPTYRV